jgi:hypothetical protein
MVMKAPLEIQQKLSGEKTGECAAKTAAAL